MFTKTISKLLLAIIKVYQNFISPMLPARCRYYPTCSEYGKTAIAWHGPIKGGFLTLKRLSSCHPCGGSGIDFVPLPLYQDLFYPLLAAPSSQFFKKNFPYKMKTATALVEGNYGTVTAITLVERGVYKDCSSYCARLNAKLSFHKTRERDH